MTRSFLIAASLLILSTTRILGADAEPARTDGGSRPDNELRTNLGDLARGLSTLFPPVEGRIIRRKGSIVAVEGEGASLLPPGVLLDVYREGEPFAHPITHLPLGRFEEVIGQIEVKPGDNKEEGGLPPSESSPRPQALAQAKPDARMEAKVLWGEVPKGGRARLSAARIPLAVSGRADPLIDALSSALVETGRFALVEGDSSYRLLVRRPTEGLLLELLLENPKGAVVASLRAAVERRPSDLLFDELEGRMFESVAPLETGAQSKEAKPALEHVGQ